MPKKREAGILEQHLPTSEITFCFAELLTKFRIHAQEKEGGGLGQHLPTSEITRPSRGITHITKVKTVGVVGVDRPCASWLVRSSINYCHCKESLLHIP